MAATAMQDLIDAWEDLRGILKLYRNAFSTLNPPCSADTIRNVEQDLGFDLPEPLTTLLKLNNGQAPDSTGVFKSVSGWNVYSRHTFLDAENVAVAYKAFLRDENLLEELGDQEIPFAVEGKPNNFKEMFSIHRGTGKVSLIRTLYDPLMPPSWQTNRFARGPRWIEDAKKEETRRKRLAEAVGLLEQNKKLGLK